MSEIRETAASLRDTAFLEDLLEAFVDRGLGSLPGRETTIAVVQMLLRHHPTWSQQSPADYELARLLRTSPRKVRNIRDELSYRDAGRTDEWCRTELVRVLERAERVPDGAYVTFEIDDGLVRDYARKLVRENYGLFESGMNASVVKLSGKTFATLAIAVMPAKARNQLLRQIPLPTGKPESDGKETKSPVRLFIDSFAKKAGEQAGRQTSMTGICQVSARGGRSQPAVGEGWVMEKGRSNRRSRFGSGERRSESIALVLGGLGG